MTWKNIISICTPILFMAPIFWLTYQIAIGLDIVFENDLMAGLCIIPAAAMLFADWHFAKWLLDYIDKKKK